MFAKLHHWMIGALVALLLAAPASVALAQGEDPPAEAATPGTFWRGGEVTALGDDSFTVIGRRGETHEIQVTEATQFFDRDANPVSFSDLAVGDRIFGGIERDAAGQLTAKLVVIVGPFDHLRVLGTISALNTADQSFTFTSRPGRVFEVRVDAATVINSRTGRDLTFADLAVGDHLLLTAEQRADGQWWATRIGLRPANQTR